MRIVHFDADSLGAPYAGGQARRTFEIDRLLARRHDVTVITAGHPSLRPVTVDGVRYARMLPLPYPLNVADYFAEIVPRAWLARADILVEDFAVPLGPSGLPAFVRRPVVAVASFLFARELSRKYRMPFDRWERRALARYRYIVALTQTHAAALKTVATRAQVRVIPNGADGAAFAHRWTGEGGYVAFLGRLDTGQKGVDLLLDAAQRLPGGLRVRIAGDGPAHSWLRTEIERRGLNARVELVGRLDGDARHQFLARAAVVAFPSRYETQGLVLLDALAMGAPVVAFGIDAVRETLGEAGILVEPFDVDAFAAALRHMAGDRDAASLLSARAGERGTAFRWETAAQAQEQFYESVLDLTGRTRSGRG